MLTQSHIAKNYGAFRDKHILPNRRIFVQEGLKLFQKFVHAEGRLRKNPRKRAIKIRGRIPDARTGNELRFSQRTGMNRQVNNYLTSEVETQR